MSNSNKIKDMDPDAAMVQLQDWVASMEERADKLTGQLAVDTWARHSPVYMGQFDAAVRAGNVGDAMRRASAVRMVLYACEHPPLAMSLRAALCKVSQELAQWLGA